MHRTYHTTLHDDSRAPACLLACLTCVGVGECQIFHCTLKHRIEQCNVMQKVINSKRYRLFSISQVARCLSSLRSFQHYFHFAFSLFFFPYLFFFFIFSFRL